MENAKGSCLKDFSISIRQTKTGPSALSRIPSPACSANASTTFQAKIEMNEPEDSMGKTASLDRLIPAHLKSEESMAFEMMAKLETESDTANSLDSTQCDFEEKIRTIKPLKMKRKKCNNSDLY